VDALGVQLFVRSGDVGALGRRFLQVHEWVWW